MTGAARNSPCSSLPTGTNSWYGMATAPAFVAALPEGSRYLWNLPCEKRYIVDMIPIIRDDGDWCVNLLYRPHDYPTKWGW